MRETILIAACLDKDRRNKLTRALLPLRIRLKEISKEDYGKPIGFFAGIKELDPGELAWNGEELSSELLVMAGVVKPAGGSGIEGDPQIGVVDSL